MSILSKISELLKFPKVPRKPLPTPLILLGENRSGISQLRTYQNVLARENEIYESDRPDNKLIEIIIEEIYNDILTNMVVEIAVPPNAIVTAKGSDATGTPVVVVGKIVNIQKAVGVPR
jgi:hypothetical protein